MSNKVKVLSPSKENLSPTKSHTKSDPLAELMAIVRGAGLKLPSHLDKHFGNDNSSFMKVIPTEKNIGKDADVLQKLKVKLGDTEFQLKKLEEDFAQYKLNSRLEKQKEIKRWQQAYNCLKNSMQYSTEDASIKLNKLKQQHQKDLQSQKQKHEAQTKQLKQKLISSYEQKISNLKKLHDRQQKQLKDRLNTQLNAIKNKLQEEIKQLKENYDVDTKKLAIKYKETFDAKEKQYESIYLALQSEKKTQEKLHEKTRIQACQAKQKLYSQLYYEKNVRKDVQENLQKRQQDIKAMKGQIRDLQLDLLLQKQNSKKSQSQLKQQFQSQTEALQQANKDNLQSFLTTHNKQLKKLQQQLHQIQEWSDNKQIIMQQRYNEVEAKFDQRPSRQEDIDLIEKLRAKLARKEEEVRLLGKELKICVLESQNKEETYNKIFTSNTVNKLEKKFLAKDRQEFKSRDSLCRKSQTTDIKFLLKVYNKHL